MTEQPAVGTRVRVDTYEGQRMHGAEGNVVSCDNYYTWVADGDETPWNAHHSNLEVLPQEGQ